MSRKDSIKSAPILGRKRNEKKMSSMREIDIWVNQGNSKELSSRTSAKNVGLLTENVTEDIMLYARQCELGRERYKFLVNHAYEKQKFLEHQNKKEKSMKKQMLAARKSIERIIIPQETRKRMLTIRIPQVDELDPTAEDTDEPDGVVQETIVPIAKEINIVLNSHAVKEIHLPKAIDTDKNKTKATYLNTGPNFARQTSVTKDNDTLPSVKAAVCKGVSFNDRPGSLKSVKPVKLEKVSVTRALRSVTSTQSVVKDNTDIGLSLHSATPRRSVVEVTDGSLNIWASKSPYARLRKFGHTFTSSVNDPRYVALTASLIPPYIGEQHRSNVSEIIARKDALRTGRSVCENDYRKRRHVKFIAQLLQQELAATM